MNSYVLNDAETTAAYGGRIAFFGSLFVAVVMTVSAPLYFDRSHREPGIRSGAVASTAPAGNKANTLASRHYHFPTFSVAESQPQGIGR